jgi:hypothetical protein
MKQKQLDLSQVPVEWFDSEGGLAYLKRIKLQEAWIGFLKRWDFDSWFTVTFADPTKWSMLAVDRTIRVLRLVTKRLNLSGLESFVVAEPHQNGSYHAHGMLALHALNEEMAKKMLSVFWKISFDIYGFNRFQLMRNGDAVRTYVTKYITKSPTDWQIATLWIRHRKFGNHHSRRVVVC